MKQITRSEKETQIFARAFAVKLRGGEVLALNGDLGAGKTAFTKGLAKGLGVKRTINSPTFVLMKVYPVSLKGKQSGIKHLVHVDAYRVSGAKALAGIGLEDYIGSPEAVVVIEWAERVKGLIPKRSIDVSLENKSADIRLISIQ